MEQITILAARSSWFTCGSSAVLVVYTHNADKYEYTYVWTWWVIKGVNKVNTFGPQLLFTLNIFAMLVKVTRCLCSCGCIALVINTNDTIIINVIVLFFLFLMNKLIFAVTYYFIHFWNIHLHEWDKIHSGSKISSFGSKHLKLDKL